MKTKLGILCVILGVLLMAGALHLHLRNEQEQNQAAESANVIMPQLVEAIHQRVEEQSTSKEPTDRLELPEGMVVPVSAPMEKEMPVVEIDGYGYVGFVGLPTLEQELPVMADWSYPQLKMSPCRFTGSTVDDNLVVMAHNYSYHFGSLKDLRVGDTVTFTDMDAQTIYYEVVALDVLGPYDVEEMTSGEYDLTLFTCNYSGKARVTVRCDRMEKG